MQKTTTSALYRYETKTKNTPISYLLKHYKNYERNTTLKNHSKRETTLRTRGEGIQPTSIILCKT